MISRNPYMIDELRHVISLAKDLGNKRLLKELLKDVPIMDYRRLGCYAQLIKNKAEEANRVDVLSELHLMGLVY